MFRRRKAEAAPPGQGEIVDRVLCIAVTAMLGAVIANLRDGALDDEQAAQYATESHRWLRRENLADSLSVRERALVAKPLEEWSEQEAIEVGWGNEPAAVLLWAISVIDEIPPYDTRFEESAVARPAARAHGGFPPEPRRLRPAEEIGRARDVAALWHGRSHTTKLAAPGARQAEGADFDAVDAPVGRPSRTPRARSRHRSTATSRPTARPIASSRTTSTPRPTSIAKERLRAFNWLRGSSSDWDSVPPAS